MALKCLLDYLVLAAFHENVSCIVDTKLTFQMSLEEHTLK